MRKHLYEIVYADQDDDYFHEAYDVINIIVIILSLVPLMFTQKVWYFTYTENFCVAFFIFDYIIRLIIADYKVGKGRKSFLIYPFTPMAIIDLLAILPMFLQMNSAFKAIKIIRTFRVLRIIKLGRYSDSLKLLQRVLKREGYILLTLLGFALFFIFASALLVFQVECDAQPSVFNNFFDALWWAVAALTTVGYGDIYPITVFGRVVSMLLAIMGIALIALPSGVITAGFVKELQNVHTVKSEEIELEIETDNKKLREHITYYKK